jgi:hypothetical protein
VAEPVVIDQSVRINRSSNWIAIYLADPPAGHARVPSNDVTIDDRGLIYLVDRQRGVDIIETNVL